MTRPRAHRRAGAAALAATLVGALAAAPPAAGADLPRGEWTERIVTAADPEQSYALYVPSAYDPGHAWPVLVVMDARGRALDAARRFEAGAERFGWIVVSAYGTVSDGAWEPNQRALAAVIPDAERRVSLDPRRLHLAGVSGTARIAWAIGLGVPDLGGLVAASGGTPEFEPPRKPPHYPWFGTAGRRDFNFQEMVRLDRALDALGSPHRLVVFDGLHQWMPEEVATEAIAWLELQAMRSGARPVEPALVAERLRARLAEAATLAAEGRPLEAKEAYEAIVRDFAALETAMAGAGEEGSGAGTGAGAGNGASGGALAEGLARARGEVRRLEREPATRRAAAERRRHERAEAAYTATLASVLGRFRGSALPSPGSKLAGELRIEALAEQARGDDRAAADSAARRLAAAYTQLSFYLPRELAAAGDDAHAAVALEVAHRIHDGAPDTWYRLAAALARAGRHDAALEALEGAIGRGYDDLAALEADESFAGLREREGYGRLVDRLAGPGR